MRKIYILTTYTGTTLSYLIKKITDTPYPHVSISIDEMLDEVYSFGRIHYSNPIFAGFVREYIDDGLYKKKKDTMCRVYSICVKDNQYKDIVNMLDYFLDNRKKFKYDSKALVRFLYKEPKINENKFVCSQFVAYILESAGVNLFNKGFNSITPLDFYKLSDIQIEYEGLLSQYRNNYLMRKELNYIEI
ncbi:hypothetical protein ACSW8S_20155 (plasmid) [Clostridium perfringens]